MFNKQLSDKLSSKTIEQYIVNNISKDFNLAPLLVEAYFNQIKDYFLHHTDIDLLTGQVHYLAIEENEPAGKPIALCKKISVALTLHNPEEDIPIYKKSGLRGLRQHKLLRITNEAITQGGVLSYEDLAFILTSSVVTIKRDMSQMRRQGIILPSRGWHHEMGRGQTHKREIISLYLQGYLVPTICQRTNYSNESVERYIRDFESVKLLATKFDDVETISRIIRLSPSVVKQYLDLVPLDS